MKNDKITICFTDPNTGKEIKTDCTERSDISLDYIREQSDAIYQGLIQNIKTYHSLHLLSTAITD